MISGPHCPSAISTHCLARRFLDNLAVRVQSGFLSGAPKSRNRYVIKKISTDRLRICSSGLLTGINVGLNDKVNYKNFDEVNASGNQTQIVCQT